MRFYEFNPLLTENKIDFVANQLDSKIMAAYQNDNGQKPQLDDAVGVVTELSKASKKAVQWLANRYVRREFKLEDVPQIKDELIQFNKVSSKLSPEQKDLNKLSLRDLYKVLEPFEDTEVVSNKEADRKEKEEYFSTGQADLIYKDKELVVIVPKTANTSCFFGKGTKWCTAGIKDNMFTYYNKQGPLYIIMTKEGKYQLQFESDSFMNAMDEDLSHDEIKKLVSRYPKLYEIFDKIATKHAYLPFIKNPDWFVQLRAVDDDPNFISFIDDPSEEVQLRAVNNSGRAIEFIKTPTEQVQLSALNEHGRNIKYIKNPSEKIQIAAVTIDRDAIKLIKNPSDTLIKTMVNQGCNIHTYKSSNAEKVQYSLVSDEGEILFDFKHPSPQVKALVNKSTS